MAFSAIPMYLGVLGSPDLLGLGVVRLPGCLQAAWRFGLGVQSCFLSAAPAASPKIHGVGNPWGGKSLENPLTNPGFLETQISAKSQGLKTSWPFFIKF